MIRHLSPLVVFLVVTVGIPPGSTQVRPATVPSQTDCLGSKESPTERKVTAPEYGSLPRHQLALVWGVPEPYRSMKNPLIRTKQIVKEGADVYARRCASCHGDTGVGDGPAAKGLAPGPGNLAWLSRMPMAQWDPFMFWTIAEGGAPFGTGMPGFKGVLYNDEIWAVTAYIQARLPKPAP